MARYKEDVLERLNKNKWVVGDCWRWLGHIEKGSGYGTCWYNDTNYRVHRVSAHLYLGLDIKSNLYALHKPECKFKDCWNPEHLYIGTHDDNMRDYREYGK
jgi:Autographiviridae endonuclease